MNAVFLVTKIDGVVSEKEHISACLIVSDLPVLTDLNEPTGVIVHDAR